jgi:hypothetical protein
VVQVRTRGLRFQWESCLEMARRHREPPPPQERDWLLASELYAITGMSESTINRYARGQLQPPLPFYRVGLRKRLFIRAEVLAWRAELQGVSK